MDRREFLGLCGGAMAGLLARLFPQMEKKRQFDEIVDIGILNDILYVMGYEDGVCRIAKSDDMGIIFYEVCQFALDSRPVSMAIMLDCLWFIGCDNGDLWSSDDEGQTWNREQYEIQGGMDAVAWAGGSTDFVEVWP